MINPRVKTVSSTSSVDFRNTSGAFYDMIISIQNQTINQSITILDTEGNEITEQPIVLTVPAKVILKDVKIGSISFSDSNSYSVIISYVVKESSSGIPYIDIDYQNGYIYVQETGIPNLVTDSFVGSTGYTTGPPSGKKWILRSLILQWKAAATTTDYPQIQIFPSSTSSQFAHVALNLYFDSLAVTENDDYIVDLSKYVQSRSSQEIEGAYVSEYAVPSGFEIYSNETLKAYVNGESADVTFYLSYIEVNLG